MAVGGFRWLQFVPSFSDFGSAIEASRSDPLTQGLFIKDRATSKIIPVCHERANVKTRSTGT